MIIVSIVCGAIAILALVFAASCYRELWRWANQMNHARIAIAYKGKVKLPPTPLVEWMLWTNAMNQDARTTKNGTARTIYQMGGTTVVLTKDGTPPSRLFKAIRNARPGRRRTAAPVQSPQVVDVENG